MRIGPSTPGTSTVPGAPIATATSAAGTSAARTSAARTTRASGGASAAPGGRGFDPARGAGCAPHPGVGTASRPAGTTSATGAADASSAGEALRARFADLDVRDPAQLDAATDRYVEVVLDRRFAGVPAETRAAMEGDVARVLRQDPAFRARLRAALLR